jgi:hypothetical protein
MTDYLVKRARFFEERFCFPALMACVFTTRMKPATRWHIKGASDLSEQTCFYLYSSRLRLRHGRKERNGIRMQWFPEYLVGIAQLNYFAKIHDPYPGTHMTKRSQVMGNDKICKTELSLKVAKEVQDQEFLVFWPQLYLVAIKEIIRTCPDKPNCLIKGRSGGNGLLASLTAARRQAREVGATNTLNSMLPEQRRYQLVGQVQSD